jgi:hypothetical protein
MRDPLGSLATNAMRRPTLLLRILLTLAAAGSTLASAQSNEWEYREYGVGVVKYAAMYSYTATDVILAAPSRAADTIATLTRDSLCFAKPRGCVRSYDRMIEFDYEVPGWAILRFSQDSAWVKVTLDPSHSSGPVGWVRVRSDTAVALLWTQVLPGKPLFFLHPAEIAFYDRPDRGARVDRQLMKYPSSERFNYIMNPLVARGRWLRVQLMSPSNLCESPEPTVRADTVWIEYLTPANHPRVFYYTRGC